MKKILLNASFIFLFVITPYVLLFIVSSEKQKFIFEEDGIFETVSSLYYFLSAGILFYLFFKSKFNKDTYFLKKHRNYFFLLLGLFFVVCGGEEISWGQRIFNLNTPEFWKEINVQNEINLHNLKIFDVVDVNDQSNKKGLARLITTQRIYSLIWLFYCVLIPILNKLSPKVQNFLRKLNFPVVPIWIAPFFLFNFLVAKAIEKIDFFTTLYLLIEPKERYYSFIFRITENKEHGYAFLYLVVGISFYVLYKKNRSEAVVGLVGSRKLEADRRQRDLDVL